MRTLEEWRPVPGYEALYSVSNEGRVRSEARVLHKRDGRTHPVRERILRPIPNSGGYLLVALSRDGKPVMCHVHRLVLAAFVGPLPPGLVSRHMNGHRLDNRLSNLQYGTPSENMFDKVRHGTDWQAAKTHCKHGHAYTEANTYRGPKGRECRTCRAARRNSGHS